MEERELLADRDRFIELFGSLTRTNIDQGHKKTLPIHDLVAEVPLFDPLSVLISESLVIFLRLETHAQGLN